MEFGNGKEKRAAKKKQRKLNKFVRNQNARLRMEELIAFQNKVDSPNPPPSERRGKKNN